MTTVIRITGVPGGVARNRAVGAGTYVYIGRPSKWGNPFKLDDAPSGMRWEAVHAFREYWYAPAQTQLRADAQVELTDKVLGCYCHPRPCHGHVIAEFLNAQRPSPPNRPQA